MPSQAELHDDLLEGADAIAEFLFGKKSKRRKVYHLMDKLPVFRLGNSVCARKSSLLSMIEDQEKAAGSKGRAA
ncbi:DNA-binding protein [Bradyrhizobium sp. AZCC 2289]|uniref:DNA-binding protein n=1 Tax=Bradyrhizobium sp. AZCC 2289 TaxID=3117026 RepID=UPI002FEFCA3F